MNYLWIFYDIEKKNAKHPCVRIYICFSRVSSFLICKKKSSRREYAFLILYDLNSTFSCLLRVLCIRDKKCMYSLVVLVVTLLLESIYEFWRPINMQSIREFSIFTKACILSLSDHHPILWYSRYLSACINIG